MGEKIEISVIKVMRIKVYIKTDSNKVITEINSSIFIRDSTEWIQIDEGYGDKYAHAQSQYLKKGLTDEKGRYNYKWENKLLEITEEEKNILFPPAEPQLTEIETLRQEKKVLAKSVYDLTSIVELLIQGGVN